MAEDAQEGQEQQISDLSWDEQMENLFAKYAVHTKGKLFNGEFYLLLKNNGRKCNHKEIEDLINRYQDSERDDHMKIENFKQFAKEHKFKIIEKIE